MTQNPHSFEANGAVEDHEQSSWFARFVARSIVSAKMTFLPMGDQDDLGSNSPSPTTSRYATT